MKKGGFIISLDFELLWGLAGHDKKYLEAYSENVRNAPEALIKIISTCAKYGIKLTIAHVGAMNFNQYSDIQYVTSPPNNQLLPAYTKPELYSVNLSNIAPELASDVKLFCCKDLLTELTSKLNVELASHTFSHYYCLEDGQTPEQFDADIKMVRDHAVADYTTIIFPRNQVSEKYLEICATYGFTHYRGVVEDCIHRPSKTKSRFSVKGALRLLDTYVPLTGYKTFNTIEQIRGMKNVPGSMFLRPYSRRLRFIEPLKILRIKLSMQHAAKSGEYFHLWWHPHNFGCNMAENLNQLEEICHYFHQLQIKYGMKSLFISEL